ncbi:hypothetical protein [Paraburkholderia sp. J10-1]|uniref:hypothetical protein n=1 Tax=Paraburkholderia sp. J10-1 TaxID=2805430 RepID=UPI002AB775D1|nr:hypothetical protein [Paraburkholderia sp. J10-1]
MFYSHTRQLGAQPGVQLNPVQDNTEGFAPDQGDQTIALVGRFKRGRIDAAFKVDRGTLRERLGAPESLRVSALNEAYVHAYEAANNGAIEDVVVRLSTPAAVNSYAVFSITGSTWKFAASATAPTTGYVFYLRDLECYNDGVKIEVNGVEKYDANNQRVATDMVTVRVRQPDGTIRVEATGSLDHTAIDDYGQDAYIGTLIAAQLDSIELTSVSTALIPVAADFYGKNADGTEKLASTGDTPLILFQEGGTAYTADDYDRAVSMLETSPYDYGYGISAGTQAVALISKMATMHIRANRQFIVDIPGGLTPEAADVFVSQLNCDTHYVQFYWAPLQTDDPVNGGKAVIGLSGYQAGLRCARNAQANAYGLAPKNYPIAGKEWPLRRTGVRQLCTPSDPQLNSLALAKINPVLFVRYNGGGKYAFTDSLTSAKVATSYRKLITVAEMSSSIDDMVVKYGRETLQLPMDLAIGRMERFLEDLFDAAGSSKWLVPSDNDALGEKGYVFQVARHKLRPADAYVVTYGLHYDGVARAIFVTQTISR